MTREEIREGIDDLLKDVFRCFKRGEWVDIATVTKKIQEYETSKGVVIKVDRECGVCVKGFTDSVPNGSSTVCPVCHGEDRKVAVEPLI